MADFPLREARLYRFVLAGLSIVWAVRLSTAGDVTIGEQVFTGPPRHWLILDHQGGWSTWEDAYFRDIFEPVDDKARDYLGHA